MSRARQSSPMPAMLLLSAALLAGLTFVETERLPGFAAHAALLADDGGSDAQAKSAEDESWQVISIGPQRIGYAHVTVKEVEQAGRKRIRTATDSHMTIKRFGQELKIQILLESEETDDGRLISFKQTTKNPPAATSEVSGRVQGDKLILRTTLAGKTTTRETDWDASIRSPAYEERQLAEKPLKPGESRSFDIFVPELRQKAAVKVVAEEQETVSLYDGTSRELLRLKTTNSLLPTATRSWVDEEGNTLKTETDLLGLVMTTYEVSSQEALKAIAGGELDLAVGSLIKVDPIEQGHASRKVVYRITTPGEDPAEFLIADESQTLRRIADDTVELTVAPPQIPRQAKQQGTNPEYLASTTFLQSGDERVKEHADKAAGDATDAGEIARGMEKYVSTNLKNKNFSTAMASAAEVAVTLEGDCTEHAVLLAAMLRAKEIPSRIAVGLVYIEKSERFGGHMWSEAWLDGKWVPLDATLGQGGIGAAHIKMAQSSFADDGPAPILSFLPMMKVLGKMEIKVVEAE